MYINTCTCTSLVWQTWSNRCRNHIVQWAPLSPIVRPFSMLESLYGTFFLPSWLGLSVWIPLCSFRTQRTICALIVHTIITTCSLMALLPTHINTASFRSTPHFIASTSSAHQPLPLPNVGRSGPASNVRQSEPAVRPKDNQRPAPCKSRLTAVSFPV